MPIEQALEELKKYAQELTNVGDAKQAIETNKDDFLYKWKKVNQYYKYIVSNTKGMSEEWHMALNIISDISFYNPSLEEWIDMIVEQKSQKVQRQSQNDSDIDTASITGPIESLLSEVKNMHYWDSEHIEDLEWQLRKYQKMLISNQNLFEPSVYQGFMDDIKAAFDKLEEGNNMISETMEGKKLR